MIRSDSRRRRRAVALVVASIALVAACGGPTSTFPAIGTTPEPAGDQTAATTKVVMDALAAAGLQAIPAVRSYRPVEGALLAAAPRTVLQVTLPADPDHGYIIVYALPTAAAAAAAAKDHAAYLSASAAKAFYPRGTQFVLRIIGSNVVFFSWLPANSPDSQTPQIERVLETLGSEVQVPG
jgi:hypothetical protein